MGYWVLQKEAETLSMLIKSEKYKYSNLITKNP